MIFKKYATIGPKVISSLQFHQCDSYEEKKAAFSQVVDWIEIETSSQCNRKCSYCPNSIYDRHSKNEFLDMSYFEKILNNLSEIDYSGQLNLLGTNEIFLHDYNFEYINRVKNKIPRCFLHIFSNGDYLTPQIMSQLAMSRVNKLTITLHSPNLKNYNVSLAMKEVYSLSKRLDIRLYLDSYRDGEHVYFTGEYNGVHILIGTQNYKQVGHSWAGITRPSTTIRTRPCMYPLRQFIVNHKGDIFMCCFPVKDRTAENEINHAITGNISEYNTIFDAYNSPEIIRWRKMTLDGSTLPKPCTGCEGHISIDDEAYCCEANNILQYLTDTSV